MSKYNSNYINNLIGLIGNDGNLIDIFNLHGLLFVGNTKNGEWNLGKTYSMFSEHSLNINIDDFEDCESDDDINDKLNEVLKEALDNKLI